MPAPPQRRDWPVRLAAAVLIAVILGPLAWPGYALSYDMVFVPRQRLSWHLIAPVEALPRAVPLDAVVGLANLIVNGAVLQRIALAGLKSAFASLMDKAVGDGGYGKAGELGRRHALPASSHNLVDLAGGGNQDESAPVPAAEEEMLDSHPSPDHVVADPTTVFKDGNGSLGHHRCGGGAGRGCVGLFLCGRGVGHGNAVRGQMEGNKTLDHASVAPASHRRPGTGAV